MPAAVYSKVGSVLDIGSFLTDRFKLKHDDDVVDRLNYIGTTSMLGLLATMLALKQYAGEPLQCWIPAQFKSPWETYSERYCFVENTYFVGLDEDIFPRTMKERESRELIYYQWVPIFLCVQLIFFLIPKALWSSLNWRTGLTLTTLVDASKLYVKNRGTKTLKAEKKVKEDAETAADFLYNYVKYTRSKYEVTNSNCCGLKRLINGNYVTVLYLMFKFLNVANAFVQLYVLNKFLGPQYTFWGWGIAMDLWNKRKWKQSGHFPRVTYCDVQIREIGQNIHTHTFQCVLMINMLNEKIFICIWFWLFFLAGLNLVNFIYWCWLCTKTSQKQFLKKHLRYRQVPESEIDSEKFYQDMFYSDVVTLLRLLACNCSDIVSTDIIEILYRKYADDEKNRREAAKLGQENASDRSTPNPTGGKRASGLPNGPQNFANPSLNDSINTISTNVSADE